jgi:coatomer subunit alpha
LAYLTAKTNGLDDLASGILEAAGLTEADVDDVPTFGASTLRPPTVVTPTTDLLWPSLSSGENFFDRALVNGQLEGGVEPAYVNSDATAAAAGHSALDAWAKEEEVRDEIDPEVGGWELDADGGEFQSAEGEQAATADEEEEELGAGATPGPSETELWVRNSPLAVDHVAAGSFETAMQVWCSPPLEKLTPIIKLF